MSNQLAEEPTSSLDAIPAFIFAGGRSQRFGEDKARVVVDGQPLITSLAEQLRAAGHAVRFVADRADRYSDLHIQCLVDCQPESGPLAALITALDYQRQNLTSVPALAATPASPWILVTSCDQLCWRANWSRSLCRSIPANHGAMSVSNQRAIVFADQRWQPLPGLYHIDLWPTVHQRLERQQLSLHGLLDACQSAGQCQQVSTEDPPSRWSFNTRAEFDSLMATR